MSVARGSPSWRNSPAVQLSNRNVGTRPRRSTATVSRPRSPGRDQGRQSASRDSSCARGGVEVAAGNEARRWRARRRRAGRPKVPRGPRPERHRARASPRRRWPESRALQVAAGRRNALVGRRRRRRAGSSSTMSRPERRSTGGAPLLERRRVRPTQRSAAAAGPRLEARPAHHGVGSLSRLVDVNPGGIRQISPPGLMPIRVQHVNPDEPTAEFWRLASGRSAPSRASRGSRGDRPTRRSTDGRGGEGLAAGHWPRHQ